MSNNNIRNNSKPKIATLNDIKNQSASQGNDKPQNLYTGGGSSGLEVEGSRRNANPDSNNRVSSLFEAAKNQGAISAEEYEKKAGVKEKQYFQGNAYKLGDSVSSSQHFHVPQQKPPAPPPLITITFWQNGFTVDDGELRAFDDPRNQNFLKDIENGVAPEELLQKNPGRARDIEIRLEDKREQLYKPPEIVKPKIVPFSGTGFALGADSDNSNSNNNNNSNKNANANVNVNPITPINSNQGNPGGLGSGDETTRLQIQFFDGTRSQHVLSVNTTLLQLRQYMESIRPVPIGKTFHLMITYPRKVLDDDSLTLTEAKLLDSLIVQKLD